MCCVVALWRMGVVTVRILPFMHWDGMKFPSRSFIYISKSRGLLLTTMCLINVGVEER
jgi:hypothetical protein